MPGVGGSAPVCAPSAARSAAPASAGIGHTFQNRSESSQPMSELVHNTARMTPSARAATPPARAALAVDAMPVMSSDTTSGTIVMRSPSSHMPPKGSATDTMCGVSAPPDRASPAPSARPTTSARRMRTGVDMREHGGRAPPVRQGPGRIAILTRDPGTIGSQAQPFPQSGSITHQHRRCP